jgi:hypothetical protein
MIRNIAKNLTSLKFIAAEEAHRPPRYVDQMRIREN